MVGVQFYIYPNPKFVLSNKKPSDAGDLNQNYLDNNLKHLAKACDYEFDEDKMRAIVIKTKSILCIDQDSWLYLDELFGFLEKVYYILLERATTSEIDNRYKYFLRLIEIEGNKM